MKDISGSGDAAAARLKAQKNPDVARVLVLSETIPANSFDVHKIAVSTCNQTVQIVFTAHVLLISGR